MILCGLNELVTSAARGCIVSVGNFDGVHSGHRLLIDNVVQRAKKQELSSALVTFEPHTRVVLQSESEMKLLTSFEEKAHLIEMAGVDILIQIPFSREFSAHPPEYFIENVLFNQLHAREWVMGKGHGIGRDREGRNNLLHTLLSKYHIIPFTADLLIHSETVVSSTEIRVNIAQGHIAESFRMLGHPYLIMAERVSGRKIGTELGFPTLNFLRPPSQKVIPPSGVYAAELEFDGCTWQGALYFGDCPTFTDRTTHFEFHSFQDDRRFPAVGEKGKLWLHTFIRDDKTYPSKEALSQQIDKDIKCIQHFFLEEKRHAINEGT